MDEQGQSAADYNDRIDSEPGTTAILTPEGWEVTDYVEPGDDWVLQGDGSYISPDGGIRTWPPEAT